MSAVPLTHNLLLDAMPEASRRRIGEAGRVIEFQLEEVPFREHEPSPLLFPLDAVVSLLRQLEDGTEVEVGMIGSEGVVGVNALLGVPGNAHTSLIQGRGEALQVDPVVVRHEMERERKVADLLHKFIYSHIASMSQLAVCNRLHTVEQRLAHWLLILHDRAGSDVLSLTHEFLSRMLATRRPGITVAMGALAAAGAIEQGRNRVRVSDRRRLEEMACGCHAAEVADFERALGFRPVAKPRVSEID